jgi:hypothetical protein
MLLFLCPEESMRFTLSILVALLSCSLFGCGVKDKAPASRSEAPAPAKSEEPAPAKAKSEAAAPEKEKKQAAAPAEEKKVTAATPPPAPKAEPKKPLPPAGEVATEALTVHLAADGKLKADGVTLETQEQFANYFKTALSKRKDGTRKLNALPVSLHVAPRTPYKHVLAILHACCTPGVRTLEIHVPVSDQAGSPEQTLRVSVVKRADLGEIDDFEIDRSIDSFVCVRLNTPKGKNALAIQVTSRGGEQGQTARLAPSLDKLADALADARKHSNDLETLVIQPGGRILSYQWASAAVTGRKAGFSRLVFALMDPLEFSDEMELDPSLPINYNVNRIEEVTVPGPVDPKELIPKKPDLKTPDPKKKPN